MQKNRSLLFDEYVTTKKELTKEQQFFCKYIRLLMLVRKNFEYG